MFTCYKKFVRNLGWGRSASALVSLPNQTEAWVACPVFGTDLDFFYSIHVPIFSVHLWVWLGTLQDYYHAQCSLSLSTVIRMKLVIRQSDLPACLAEVQLDENKHSLEFMPQAWWSWQIKWLKSVSMWSFQYKSKVNGECFASLWLILLYFSPESNFGSVGISSSCCFKNYLGQ